MNATGRERRAARTLVCVVAVTGIALGVCSGAGAASAPTTRRPARREVGATWDPRIEPIAREVAQLRHLRFLHPVAVRFLSEAAFEKQQRSKASDLSKAQKAQVRRSQGELRALGLIGTDVDLLEAGSDIRSSDVLAYYDPSTKRITVKGDGPLDAATRVTVAHELTHALQDQHFDLEKLERVADRSHASTALRAVVEGDAVRIQTLYAQEQSLADQEEEARSESSAAGAAAAGGYQMLSALFEAPYAFGPSLVQVAQSSVPGGIDGLLRHPPANDAAYLSPWTVVQHTSFRHVPVPTLRRGERQVGRPDVFGPFALYLVLASRIGPDVALNVADEWGGDSMISFRRHGQQCLRARFVGRRPVDASTMATALGNWARPMPPGAATVVEGTDDVTLTACDTGDAAPAVAHDGDEIVAFAASRDGLYSELLQQGLSSKVAQCAADGTVRDRAFSDLVAVPDQEPSSDQVTRLRQRVAAVVATCALRR